MVCAGYVWARSRTRAQMRVFLKRGGRCVRSSHQQETLLDSASDELVVRSGRFLVFSSESDDEAPIIEPVSKIVFSCEGMSGAFCMRPPSQFL